MRFLLVAALAACALGSAAQAQDRGEYLGQYSRNPYIPAPLPQPRGTFANPLGDGSNSPKLYDGRGRFFGNLNANRFDPDSVANPYGRYGSRYSPDSINNPYGLGSPYHEDSPNNPYGRGLRIYR